VRGHAGADEGAFQMRLCLMIEGQEGVSWEQWMALAEVTERSGLEGLFRSDHYLSGSGRVGRGSSDAWTTLAAIAARTERIRLGTMVSPVTFRHPSVLASAANVVDHVSGGRVELGLGAGWYELEHRAFGFPFPPVGERMEMLEEQLEIVHRQWTEDELSFQGKHYQLDRCPALPKPVQKPRPPIVVGGGGKPRTVAAAARFAQEYNTTEADPAECAKIRRRLDEACQKAGRDPSSMTFSVMTTTIVGRDQAEVERRVKAAIEGWDDRPAADVLAENRDTDWIAGTVDEVVERLRGLRAAGVERVMLQHLDHADIEMVELLGSELVPRAATL
jgi:F420-dependent oxidoreductase-like protein